MSMGTLGMVADSVHGVLHGADREFDAVSTDTRSLSGGELFVALRGPNFDAADFIDQAERLGAAGALVERRTECELAQVEVVDTRLALGDLARFWRTRFVLPVIGITGSNGKTTVKEMCAAIMRVHCGDGAAVLATRGNLNNDIGLPLMVLELRDSHRAAVLEMGASAAGEIDYLAKIAAPHIGILTNAGPAHLEGFGSIAGVARAKGELFDALADDGIAIINHDDAYYSSWRERCGSRRVISFGLHPDADVRAEAIRVAENGCMAFSLCNGGDVFPVSLPMPGQHNVPNALAAAAAALAAGVAVASIQAGLLATRNVGGRLLSVTSASGAQLFDDSYNANPASLEAAITFLAAQPGETWLVLGDMGELGPESEQLHRDCGKVARDAGLSRVLCVGGLARAAAAAFGPGGRSFDSREELVAAVGSELKAGITVLVKGSRSMGMEKVVAGLAAAGGER